MNSGQIIPGDCRDALPQYEGCAHMVLTDPPFAISNSKNSSGTSKAFSGYTSDKGDWDTEVPAELWVPKAYQTLVPGGIFACFGVYGSLIPIFQQLQSMGARFQSHIIWHKTNPAPSIHRRMLTHANEIILVFSKGSNWYFDYQYSKTLNFGKQCHNVLNEPAVKKVLGVTRKPPLLCEKLTRLFCPEGDVVIDPFAGSGGIPLGVQKANRAYVAMEKRLDLVAHMKKELCAANSVNVS